MILNVNGWSRLIAIRRAALVASGTMVQDLRGAELAMVAVLVTTGPLCQSEMCHSRVPRPRLP